MAIDSSSSGRTDSPKVTQTSNPSPEFLQMFISSVAAAFVHNPMANCFSSNRNPELPPDVRREAHLRRLVHRCLQTEPGISAVVAEAGGFAATAVWEYPSYAALPSDSSFPNITSGSMGPFLAPMDLAEGPAPHSVLLEFLDKVGSAKREYLGVVQQDAHNDEADAGNTVVKPHFHLAVVGRTPGREAVKGAVSALIRPWLRQADKHGLPAWLEATSAEVARIYEHFGFRICAEIRVGVGTRAADGSAKDGGEGMLAYGMLYEGSKDS